MKQTIYPALGIVLLSSLGNAIQAQAPLSTQTYVTMPSCPGATSVVDYLSSQCNIRDEKRTDKETIGNTSYTFSNYSSTAAGANSAQSTTNDVFQFTNRYSSQISGTALVWRQDNTQTPLAANVVSNDVNTNSPFKSRVLLTFTREVTNLRLVFQDIDKALLSNGGGSDFTDEVDFYPQNAAGIATDISGSNVAVGYGVKGDLINSSTCAYGVRTRDGVPQAILQGYALNGGSSTAPRRDGNATIVFKKPVKTLWITYRNLNTLCNSELRLQTIAIEEVSWCTVTSLPVTLTTFEAKAAGVDAQLNWAVANETNNDYFAIERSFDGVSFSEIGQVKGHGNTTVASSYPYTDAAVASKATGTVYYRLRQVDLDGTATYSPVRTVAFEKGTTALKIYPNPATPGNDQLTLDLLTLPQGDYQASLLNVVGSTVATYTVHGGETQPVALPTSLAPGTYLLRVQGQGVQLTQRFAQQ